MATNMASTSSDSSGRGEISKEELPELSEHHKQTGCSEELQSYTENGDIKGAFCPSCKEEWLLKSINKNVTPDCGFTPVVHHYVPTFCCLQVSDTGHYVRMRDIDKLKRGDHVAWQRLCTYWHHGIVTEDVEEGADELSVMEYNKERSCNCCTIGITIRIKNKGDVTGCCCCSQMYKVVYPKEVEDQNPPDLVMLRARKMEKLSEIKVKGYSPFFDNCEHFATFCKTGSHKCNQLFQYKSKFRAWVTRIAVACLYVVFVVFFAETIEFLVPTIDEDYLAVIVLAAFEFLYWVIIIVITYRHDTHREGFKRKGKKKERRNAKRSCTSACKRAVVKSGLQSFTFAGFVALFGIGGVRLIGRWRVNYIDQWSVQKRIIIEMAMGILGGIFGSIFSYCLFQLIPYPCCRTNIGEDEDTYEKSGNGEGEERQALSQTSFEGGTHVHEERGKAGDIELPRREIKDLEIHEMTDLLNSSPIDVLNQEQSSSDNEDLETQAFNHLKEQE